ncbi:MAG: tetratricopeptide repeat protein [Planctomycetota bacterium]
MRNLTAILLALALVAPTLLADTIVLRGQPAISGVKVQKEDLLEIAYTKGTGGRRLTVPTVDVIEVIYDAPPTEYRLGVESLNLGDAVNAIPHLEASLRDEVGQAPWVKEYAGVALGRAYLASGRFGDAVKTFDAALTAKPDSRFLKKIAFDLALCHAKLADSAKAISALDKLQQTVESKKVPGTWSLEAQVMKGEVLIASGKPGDAATAMQDYASKNQPRDDADPKAPLWVRAKRLQVEALIAAKNVDLAKGVAKDLQDKSGQGPWAEAASRNARAAVAIAEKATGNELLRAAELLVRAKTENSRAVSELPTTCYLLGLVHLGLDGTLTGAKALAKSYFDETLRRFPESREAFLAREQLKKI